MNLGPALSVAFISHLPCSASTLGAAQLVSSDTTWAHREWIVGAIDGPPEYTFGQLTALAVDSSGRVYVADAFGSTVSVYTREGQYLQRLGAEGDGPGEFRHPSSITISAEQHIYVRDTRGVTVFRLGLGEGPFEVETTWPGPTFPSSPRPSRIDVAGHYYYPYSHSLSRTGEPPEHFYLIYESGAVVDTLWVPPYQNMRRTDPAWVRTSASGGRILPGLNRVPFSAVPVWDVTPRGTVVSGDGTDYLVFETSETGDTVRVIGRSGWEPSPISDDELEDSLSALQHRIDAVPVPLAQAQGIPDSVKNQDLPRRLPPFVGLHVDALGRLWVERWPPSATSSFFDIIDEDGGFLASLGFPVRFDPTVAPIFGANSMVGVVRNAESDVQFIVRFLYGEIVN